MTDKYLKYRKIRIYPNDEEKQYFDYCIGASRFIYNWALDIENDQYEKYINGQSDKQFVHDKELRVLYKDLVKKEPWLKNMQIETVRSIIHQIDNAFKMFLCIFVNIQHIKQRKVSIEKVIIHID